MPKKQKTPRKSASAGNGSAIENSEAAAKADSRPASPARKTARKTTLRKTPTVRSSKSSKAGQSGKRDEPTDEQIQLRAYFIAEHRHRHGAPGDHHSDWLEARRQLMLEAQRG